MAAAEWYWCLTHDRVEEGSGCRAEDRMGPYDSPDAATDWKTRHESRADRWDAEDRAWHGD